MATTLGAHSPILERARALRTKAGRIEQGRYGVEGPTMLAEALAADVGIETLFATERAEAALGDGPRKALADRTYVIPDRAMARLSELEQPPGLVAVLRIHMDELETILDGSPVAVLAGIGDPGNAGTLLRAAEIFGIDRAILTADSVEAHNPKVVRATMGALFRMRLASVPGETVVAAAMRAGYTIVAAAKEGTPLPQFAFQPRTLIAIGNERHGPSRSLPGWDETVAIPQSGRGESLNAAVAGGIIFYTFSQQISSKILSS